MFRDPAQNRSVGLGGNSEVAIVLLYAFIKHFEERETISNASSTQLSPTPSTG